MSVPTVCHLLLLQVDTGPFTMLACFVFLKTLQSMCKGQQQQHCHSACRQMEVSMGCTCAKVPGCQFPQLRASISHMNLNALRCICTATAAESQGLPDACRRMEFSIRCAYAHGTSALRTHLINMAPKQIELTWPVFSALRKKWAGKVRLRELCCGCQCGAASETGPGEKSGKTGYVQEGLLVVSGSRAHGCSRDRPKGPLPNKWAGKVSLCTCVVLEWSLW